MSGRSAYMSGVAAETAIALTDLRGFRLSILGHAVGELAVLLWPMALEMYKPNAVSPYGKRNRDRGDPHSAAAGNLNGHKTTGSDFREMPAS